MAARLVTITIVMVATIHCSYNCRLLLHAWAGMYYDAQACLYKSRLKIKTEIRTRTAAALYHFGTLEVSEESMDLIDVIVKSMHTCLLSTSSLASSAELSTLPVFWGAFQFLTFDALYIL